MRYIKNVTTILRYEFYQVIAQKLYKSTQECEDFMYIVSYIAIISECYQPFLEFVVINDVSTLKQQFLFG